MKNKKTKKELMFPKQLQREDIFPSPIWYGDEPGFVDELNNASDSYIEAAKKNLKETKSLVTKEIWDTCFIQQV